VPELLLGILGVMKIKNGPILLIPEIGNALSGFSFISVITVRSSFPSLPIEFLFWEMLTPYLLSSVCS
jgi:hypothetical protein